MKALWIGFAAAMMLAGCAGSASRSVETPVAAQVEGDAARQRAKVHTDLGMAYLASGQLNVALEEARVALVADPSYPLAYNLLGLAYMQMRENSGAENHFEQALRLAPNDPEIGNNMGWFLCQTGREARAFEFFEAAATNPLYETPVRPLLNAALCAGRLKDFRKAEAYLGRALRHDPNDIDGLFLLADTLFQQQRYAEARVRLAEVHRRAEPTSASAWLALRIERKVGDREAEGRWINQLRRNFPNSAEYRKLSKGAFE